MTDMSWLDVIERKDRELAEAHARLAAVQALADKVKDRHARHAWVHRDEIYKALGQKEQET